MTPTPDARTGAGSTDGTVVGGGSDSAASDAPAGVDAARQWLGERPRRTNWLGLGLGLLGAVGVAGGLVAVAVRRARARSDREIAALVATVLDGGARDDPSTDDGAPAVETVEAEAVDALDGLPAPIRRYLAHVLPAPAGGSPVRAVRIYQRGALRLGDASSPWKSLTATEHVSLDPPGFVWDATVELAPVASVRVVDAFVAGRGLLRARLGGVVPVVDATPGPALDAGELVRYLAEAPLYPMVLLSAAVDWEPIDDRSARATLSSGATTVSCVFHVNDADEVTRVTATRPRLTADGDSEPTPWIGHWRRYRYRYRGRDGDGDGDGNGGRDGTLVPTEGEVRWSLPDGDLPYWRARVDVTPIDGDRPLDDRTATPTPV